MKKTRDVVSLHCTNPEVGSHVRTESVQRPDSAILPSKQYNMLSTEIDRTSLLFYDVP